MPVFPSRAIALPPPVTTPLAGSAPGVTALTDLELTADVGVSGIGDILFKTGATVRGRITNDGLLIIPTLDQGGQQYNVEAFGADLDGAAHTLSEVYGSLAAAQAVYPFITSLSQDLNWAAFQRCEQLAGAAGGGDILVPGPMALNCRFGSGGQNWALQLFHDNVRVRTTGRGSIINLRTDATATFFVQGGAKASGLLGDGSEWFDYLAFGFAGSAVPTVYEIDGGGAVEKGATTITLSTSDAANFAAGDWLVFRTGQTLAALVSQPVAEFLRVKAVNTGTGEITLESPVTRRREQEYFISGTSGLTSTSVTANPALYGVSKVTDRLLHGIRLDVDVDHRNTAAVVTGGQTVGMQVKATGRIKTTGLLSFGTNRGLVLRDSRFHIYDAANAGYWFSPDAGSTECKCLNNTITMDGGLSQIHVHEGSDGTLIDGNTIRAPEVAADFPLISIRSRAGNVTVVNNDIVGGPNSSVIYVGDECEGEPGGVIDNNTIHNALATNGVFIGPVRGWKLGQNQLTPSTLKQAADGTIAAETNVVVGGMISIPLQAFTLSGVTATTSGGIPVLSFPSSGLTSISTRITLPPEWREAEPYVRWTNLGAGSGNVIWGFVTKQTVDGDAIDSASDVNSGSAVTAVPAEKVQKTTKATAVNVTPLAGQSIFVQLYRNPGGSDTLANAAGVLEIVLMRKG